MKLSLVTHPIPKTPEGNMALDEYLLAKVIKHPEFAFIRLYQWQVGTITFGVNQRIETAVDHSRLGETPLIRRVTGGRALYHDPSELTYSIMFNTGNPPSEKLTGTISSSSELIAEGLREFLIRMGVRTDWVRSSSKRNSEPGFFHTAPCFASSAKYELRLGNHKLVASAQRRFRSGLLQHGSIKLEGVVAHPALNGVSEVNKSLQVVESGAVEELAQVFGELFALHLDVQLSKYEFSEYDTAQFDKYYSWVCKNRLTKRIGCEEALILSGLDKLG